jgi:hypothetical protein
MSSPFPGMDPYLEAHYHEAAYDLSIDYREPPPPPPLSAAEADWLKTIVSKSGN